MFDQVGILVYELLLIKLFLMPVFSFLYLIHSIVHECWFCFGIIVPLVIFGVDSEDEEHEDWLQANSWKMGTENYWKDWHVLYF